MSRYPAGTCPSYTRSFQDCLSNYMVDYQDSIRVLQKLSLSKAEQPKLYLLSSIVSSYVFRRIPSRVVPHNQRDERNKESRKNILIPQFSNSKWCSHHKGIKYCDNLNLVSGRNSISNSTHHHLLHSDGGTDNGGANIVQVSAHSVGGCNVML